MSAAPEPPELQAAKAEARRVVEAARHVSRATEHVPELGILPGDEVLFDAAGRPLGVFRPLVGDMADVYRLRYGHHVRRAVAAQLDPPPPEEPPSAV